MIGIWRGRKCTQNISYRMNGLTFGDLLTDSRMEVQQAVHIMAWLLARRRGTGGHKNA